MCGKETILLCNAGHNCLAEIEEDRKDTGDDEKADDDSAIPVKLISAKRKREGEEGEA